MQPTPSLNDSRDWPRSFASIHQRLTATANERLKARAPLFLNRSLILAAMLHGAVLFFSPEWVRSAAAPGGYGAGPGIQVVALGSHMEGLDVDPPERDGSDAQGWDVPGWQLPVADVREGENADIDPDGGAAPVLGSVEGAPSTGGATAPGRPPVNRDARLGGASGAGLDRLAALRPTLSASTDAPSESVSPDSEPDASESGLPGESRESRGAGEGSDGVNGTTRRLQNELTEQLEERLTREEILDLERLSALRPELALTSPSSWILVRNPVEVGEFLERRFGGPQAEERPRGTLSVAIWIDERGSVEWAEINRSSGDAELDRSALELFERVVSFSPAREDGFRVPTAVIFWLSFW